MSEQTLKFKEGDTVKVVHYGHLVWENVAHDGPRLFTESPSVKKHLRDGDIQWWDISPQLVGQTGRVSLVGMCQDIPLYALSGIPGKSAWYNEGQLELVDMKPFKKAIGEAIESSK